MSARSRYLEAISPRNENRDDDVVISTAANNHNNNAVPSWQSKGSNNINGTTTAAAAKSFGLKRTSSVKSPSSISQQRTTGRSNVYNNNNINSSSNKSSSNNVGGAPPPPPPGMPVKRKKNNSSSSVATAGTTDEKKSTLSPVRGGGEQWSPREEIQSGNVQKYKNMIWGTSAVASNNNSAAAPPKAPTPPPPQPSSSSSMSPSRPTPFYKRTAPPPIVTTPNRPTSFSKTTSTSNASSSTMPTPPSRVGVRQKQRGDNSKSPANAATTPLQQRRGNLNIAPLVTNFDADGGDVKQGNDNGRGGGGSEGMVQTNTQQQQAQQHQSEPKQQGITTITAFKRPNHKVGIIFTRQSSSSPDVAIIARILPESIFAHHDDAEKRRQGSSANKGGTKGGLEGSEVIAVNGVPVRNPRHAAEMVAKAKEEVRLTICKKVDHGDSGAAVVVGGGTGGGGVNKSNGGKGMMGGGGATAAAVTDKYTAAARRIGGSSGSGSGVSPKTSPVFSPKIPDVDDDINKVDSPQSRQEEEEGIDEESTFSVRTEGPEQQQQQKQQTTSKKEPMFVVKKGPSPNKKQQQSTIRGGNVNSTSSSSGTTPASSAKKSKEIADMRRKVAQAMLLSQEMVHDPVNDDTNMNDLDSDGGDDWAPPQPIMMSTTKSPLVTKKKMIGAPPQSPKSPSIDLAERRRQAALDIYNSKDMVGDNVDDTVLGTSDVVGVKKETIGGGGLPPPVPMKDMDRVNSFGTSSVARTDVTTESMATQQMGSTSPKVVASNQAGEEEVFQFEDNGGGEMNAITTSPMMGTTRKVEREPEEKMVAATAASTVMKQSMQQHQRGAVTKDDNATVGKRAVVPPSPAKESVAESPGRKGLFGKIKSQKKMFGGMKNMLKSQKFKKSKAVDRGIPLEDDDDSNFESRVETVDNNTSRNAVPAVAPPKVDEVVPPPTTESQVVTKNPTEDLFAGPPDQSKSWGDDFFKDPFANSPFNDPAKGDPYGFPETERARNGDDAFGFDNTDSSWGEPQTLHDVKTADSTDSNGEMSEITNPSFISRRTDRKEANFGEMRTDSKENYSTENKTAAMRLQRLRKQSSSSADPPINKMETYPSSEDDREDKVVSNLMAKSRIISKYGKNRRVARGTDSAEPSENTARSPSRQIPSRPPVARSPMQDGRQQAAKNELALAREQAIARQRAIDIAAAKAKQAGAAPSSPKRYRKASLSQSRSKSPTNLSKYPPRQKKKAAPSAVYNPEIYSVENYLLQVKDPIERAGVRLLWAAAVPIQAQARRFLARQHAIKRMCAVLTIQSFVRRWNAERNLEIAVWSAIQIQAAFRGWFARDSLEDNHYCATQIQRITRGYLATIHVFEDLYSITIVQSVVRRFLAINVAVDRLSSIIAIQAWWRGIRARDAADERYYSALAIQSTWRRYMCQMTYQFDIIDIIIVQSIVRRRQALQLRKKTAAVVRIQALGRAIIAKNKFEAAKSMHDLVVRQTSATKIQTCWRSYSAQVNMLMTIVNIIVIQSLWRRRAVEKIYKPHLHRIKLAKERKRYNAATKIQSAWRGFSDFSAYTIIRYENQAATIIQSQWRAYLHSTNYCIMLIEIVRIQALVRGRQERSWLTFQNECASIIQAAMRGYLTRRELHNENMISVLISAAATSLRTRNAARTLQRWWVERMWILKEKKAALVIERFFIYVKKEVEREIKAMKKKKRQRKKMKKYMQSDDWLLENAWQGLEAASVENPAALQPATATVPMSPYHQGHQQQQQQQLQYQQQIQHQQYGMVHPGMSPPRMGGGGVLPPSGAAPGMPPQAAYNSAHVAAVNQSIPMNNSLRQQHGYRGRRYDRTDEDSLALDAAFAEASAHDSHVGSSNQQYQQRQSSKGYRGRRYN